MMQELEFHQLAHSKFTKTWSNLVQQVDLPSFLLHPLVWPGFHSRVKPSSRPNLGFPRKCVSPPAVSKARPIQRARVTASSRCDLLFVHLLIFCLG